METTTTPEMLGYYDGNTWKTFTLEDLSKPEKLMIIFKDFVHKKVHDKTYKITGSSDSNPSEEECGVGLFDWDWILLH